MMDRDDVISIHSDGSNEEQYGAQQRRAILEPAIRNVVDALGGYEEGVYRMGDEAYGCLKDLKKHWRKDDTDDDRLVARIFWEARLLPNDLVPILLETAGNGHVEDKRAIACADLITAMTWPIDLAEELKELDDEMDRGVDYTQLLQSHLYYKAALLRPGVLVALLNIILPCLARDTKQRTERDTQIINVILHLVRNLAFIKDPPANVHLSADQIDLTNMQSKLVKTLSDAHFLDLLSTIASNAVTNVIFNRWNTLVLEIYYLLFRGVNPSTLVLEQSVQAARNLRQLLTIENQRRRDFARNAPSRHSRFGTTIAVKLNPKKAPPSDSFASGEPSSTHAEPSSLRGLILHKQQAINTDSGVLIDLVKKQKKQKGKKVDELGREEYLSTESRTILQSFARTFVEACFNPFLASLLKDIKSERPKVTEKDNLRLLFVTRWFLQFFLATRTKEEESGSDNPWDFGLVGEVIERGWVVWILKRMNGAVEEKPRLWTELQAGIQCLTQLLALIDAMSSMKGTSELLDASDLLQRQLIYNGQVLDAALEGLRAYKEGTQALAFLNASVHLAYSAIRMLERWGKTKGENSYVRKRAKARRRRRGRGQDADGVPDTEETSAPVEEDVVEETLFTLEAYELKFANSEITHSLVTYLARYKEFDSSECMKRVVSLMHRQVVRAKAEGLYYQVSTLDLFKAILGDHKSFPQEQPYKDLVALITYILRQFFKAVEADSFVLVEAFFPKNRGQWKKLSSWKPEEKEKAGKKAVEGSKHPPDVQVKKGYTWSQQVAIAMAALEDAGQGDLIEWTKDILTLVIAQRKRIIEEVDGVKDDTPVDNKENDTIKIKLQENVPSAEASAKITDYLIPYISDEQADAATKNPHLKLLFRLVHFYIQEEDADELDWYIPAGILVTDLQQSLTVIAQFQENPIDLEGKRATQLLHKKRNRRARRRTTTPTSDAELPDDSDEEPRAKRKERKKKEKEQYKSAQFIEDSDDDDLEAFFARERELRERTTLAAVNSALGIGTMRKTGTKKRRRKATETSRKRRKASDQPEGEGSLAESAEDASASDSDVPVEKAGDSSQHSRPSHAKSSSISSDEVDPPPVQPRPRPRPRMKVHGGDINTTPKGEGDSNMVSSRESSTAPQAAVVDAAAEDARELVSLLSAPARRRNIKTRVVFSDEED